MAGSEGTKACRLCLIMDSGLISIDIQLENSMRNILGPNITYECGLPKYSCNECAEFLRRFKDFREKCLIAQTVLYQILKTSGQVTDIEIRKLNRKRLKLDTQITAPQQPISQIVPTEETPQEITPIEEILPEKVPFVDVLSESLNVKVEMESLEPDAMESSGSEDDEKSNVMFEAVEVESEVLLDVSNPLEEENVTIKNGIQEDFTLPPEHADLSEGFNICLLPGLDEYCSHAAQRITYNCRRCSFSAPDVETARNHRQQEHSDKMYSCCYCNHRTTNPSLFLSHVRARHSLQAVCRPCGACFDSRRGLRAHAASLHKPTPTNDSTSSSMRSKKKCKKKKIKSDVCADPKLLCAKCGIQFSTSAAWRRHLDDNHIVYENENKSPTKKRRVINHPMETLQKAFHAVKNKEMGLREASRFFKIPKSTLQCQVKSDSLRTRRGPPPIFNEEEEGFLVDFVKNEGSLNRKAVLAEAALLTKQLKREKFFKNGAPGLTWYTKFLSRHPELNQYAKKI